MRGYDAVFASGGALDDGRCGLLDHQVSAVACTRTYRRFYCYPYTADAAMFDSQSMQFRYDGALREDANGAFWQDITPRGDLLLVPPAGREGRTAEVLVKASRGVPGWGIDGGTDNISARLYVTPRFLSIPD